MAKNDVLEVDVMKKEQIILIALIVLVVLAGVQAFEIADIKSEGVMGISEGSSQQKTSITSAPSRAPSSSPMVGGC